MVTKRKLSSAKIERQLALDTNFSGFSSKLSDMEVRVPQEDKGEASEIDDQQHGTQTGDLCKEDARLSTLSGVNKNMATPSMKKKSTSLSLLMLYFTGVIQLLME
jgi:hypothetical protein